MIPESAPSRSVCLLIFGNLGESAQTSLTSIYKQFEYERFCICADETGKKWILGNTPKEKITSLCFHDPDESALQKLGLDLLGTNSYSEFGKERFIKLTTFKWQLLRDSLRLHEDSYGVLFSDLDVIWFKNPFSGGLKESTTIQAQDDTPKNSPSIHLCSGIMFFPNSTKYVKLLDKLFNSQLDANANGNLIPDEPILNDWFRSRAQRSMQVRAFDAQKYVIGHRFFHFLLGRKAIRQQAVCFHLNYVVGEIRKNRRAKALISRESGGFAWIFYAAIELFLVGLARSLDR